MRNEKDNSSLEQPHDLVEDVPLSVFEDESDWHEYVNEKITKKQNPALYEKIEKIKQLLQKYDKK